MKPITCGAIGESIQVILVREKVPNVKNASHCEPKIVLTLILNRKNMANTLISRLMELSSGEKGETLNISMKLD